ncbi:MAG: small subunit ribosomal protein [Thermotogaceae bacterium]|nr:small subunit ribosomal protein [Thermotogaceae bacterium]MDN5337402.1 small subunit ribosomal protein [Thermotogaceae bacterium]
MGQKVHPKGFRLGITTDWSSKWFNEKNYSSFLLEDQKIRNYIKDKYFHAGISEIYIERPSAQNINITIKTARVGILIGKKGSEVKELREELQKMTGKKVGINIEEIRTPEIVAQLVAENIAARIEKRASYKQAMKRSISNALRKGAKGIKVMVSGRLGGADIARTEWYRQGRVPLQTLTAKIDYGYTVAKTRYGIIGIKVWIFLGDDKSKSK